MSLEAGRDLAHIQARDGETKCVGVEGRRCACGFEADQHAFALQGRARYVIGAEVYRAAVSNVDEVARARRDVGENAGAVEIEDGADAIDLKVISDRDRGAGNRP